jgi:tetratricopeptide (TPR) repeat protein
MKESSRRNLRFMLSAGTMLLLLASAAGNSRANDEDVRMSNVYYLKAAKLDHQQDWGQALSNVNAAIRLSPTASSYYLKAVILFSAQDDDNAALAAIEKGILLDPKNPEQWSMKSKILLRLKRTDEALASADQGLKIGPNYSGLYFARGRVHQYLKQWQDAENDFTAAIKIGNRYYKTVNVDVRSARENMAAKLKHWPLVLEDSEAIISDHSKNIPPETQMGAYRMLAQAFAALGKTEQAKSAYRKGLATWPDDRRLLVNAKEFFESIGAKPDAEALTKRIKLLDEDYEPPK